MVSLEANNTRALTTFLSSVQHVVQTSALPGVLPTLSPMFPGPTRDHGYWLSQKDSYELPGMPLSRDWIQFIFSLEAFI